MAGRNDRFKKKESVFVKVVEGAIEDASRLLNAIDFIESPQGLNVKLFPLQRLIVKCVFGVPIDYKMGMVPFWDVFREKLVREVTEEEALHILYEEGRCNVANWQDIPERGFNEAAIFAGRRGGKSQVVSAIGAYKLYRLLNVRSPQEYFGLVPGSPIDFTFMAQDEEGSSRLYDKLREDINRAPFFNPYLKASSGTSMGFVSESDRNKRDVTPTINVKAYASTTNAVRGPSSVLLALDEFAHFRSAKGSSSDEVYAAATPSTTNFHHAELHDGTWISGELMKRMHSEGRDDEYREFQDSLILSISSPWTKVGKMYDLHKQALERGPESGIFTIRVSTAEMNPTILPQTLRKEHDKNPLTFKCEYGGQFLESSESYVTEAQIRACTDVQYVKQDNIEVPDESTARYNLTRFHPSCIGRQYFWAIDLGMTNDGTGVAIAHFEYQGGNTPLLLVYDYVDRMICGEKFEGPGVRPDPFGGDKYLNYKALPLEDLLAWFKALHEVMPCFRGATDQHGGQQLVQLLEINQISNIELVNLTTAINSQMAYILQGYIRDTRCRFPYVPKFMQELRLVEAEYVNKYQIRVQAPAEKGSHDDMVDAVQLCSWVAQKWLTEEGHLKLDPSGQSFLMQEQMNKPAAPITSLDGVQMSDLRFLERMKKIKQNMGNSVDGVVRNPFNRRGRR